MFLKNMNPLLDLPTVSPTIKLLDTAEKAFQDADENTQDKICKLSGELFNKLEREQTKRVILSFATSLAIGGATAIFLAVSPIKTFAFSSIGIGALLTPSLGEDCVDIDNMRKNVNAIIKVCGSAKSRIDRLKGKQDFLKKHRGTGERERAETELAITEIQKKIIKYQTLVDQQSDALVPNLECYFSFSPPSKDKEISERFREITTLAISIAPSAPSASGTTTQTAPISTSSTPATPATTATTATTTSTSLNVTIPTTPKDGPKIVFTEK